MTALQATYTMGAMTLGMSMYETDNPEGATGKYEEQNFLYLSHSS